MLVPYNQALSTFRSIGLVRSFTPRLTLLDASRTPLYVVALSLIGLPMLILGNYFGAELVYRMGMRVNTGRLRETPVILRAAASLRRRLGLGQ